MAAGEARRQGVDKSSVSKGNAPIWQPPPNPRGGRPPEWPQVLAPLMKRPGKWALIWTAPPYREEKAYALAGYLRRTSSLEGRWEIVARKREVFARYLGDEPPSRARYENTKGASEKAAKAGKPRKKRTDFRRKERGEK